MASRVCLSSTSVAAATVITMAPKSVPLTKTSCAKRKSPLASFSGSWASELDDYARLSPETPLARDGCHLTHCATRAGTTHHLAAVLHTETEYFSWPSPVKGKALQTLDA